MPYWYCKLKSFINYQIFLPVGHPKSQPFFDRVYTFSLIDDKIWFRHYQVLPEEDGSLAEIGPRFVLNPIKIFDASFSGATLWESPNFTTPAKKRQLLKRMKAGKYLRYVFVEYFFFWNIIMENVRDNLMNQSRTSCRLTDKNCRILKVNYQGKYIFSVICSNPYILRASDEMFKD